MHVILYWFDTIKFIENEHNSGNNKIEINSGMHDSFLRYIFISN